VAQIGHREEYAAARAFAADGRLARLCTDVWCGRGWDLVAKLPGPARKLAVHHHPDLADRDVVSWTGRGFARNVARAVRKPSGTAVYDDYLRHGDWFDHQVLRALGRRPLDPAGDAFFTFNTGALASLRHLRERGVPAVLDQIDPAEVEYDLIREEAERWPGWEASPQAVPAAYWERHRAEWDAAQVVVVNSRWSAEALQRQGVAPDRIRVVPLAYEAPAPPAPRPEPTGRPLTVLWLGSVILRKGIQYLVEAAKLLGDRDLRFEVVGPVGISEEARAMAPASMTFAGPLTHDRIAPAYRAADVFVLPTVSDGFALTQLEAMAHGLPVVTTPNCGDVVDDGVDGLLVPAGDATALAEALARLDDDRTLVASMAAAAPAKAAQFSLTHYRARLDATLSGAEVAP
jgi:glycosyltransferase involved in cell wall biosynthesis